MEVVHVSDRSPWITSVIDKLKDSLGTPEEKRTALWAAEEMQKNLPKGSPNAEKFGAMLRSMFDVWVHRMNYLAPEQGPGHHLPDTLLRVDAVVASNYGLSSKAAIAAKQEQLASAREIRIERAVTHINAGWIAEDAIAFVCAKDEWEAAKRKARLVAA
jgi:hypothetical protein